MDKAIKILTDIVYLRRPVEMNDHADAIKLGIEALKEKLEREKKG